jgi:hypothetical protein
MVDERVQRVSQVFGVLGARRTGVSGIADREGDVSTSAAPLPWRLPGSRM